MKTINKQPKIRFKGYTDEWQQRKLGEIAEIIMGQSPKGENYTENPDDHILVQGNADMKNGRVVPRVWTTQITKQANPEDIILSVRAPVGDVGKTDFNVVLGRGVAAIKGNEFIYQNLKKMKETGFWTRFSTGSTFESINSTDLKDALLLLPSNEEQIEIGNFFKQLDDIIALHQRKLEALEKTKKFFLQKMFPKKDETKPEIRFAGYTDDWEQRKLGEVAHLSSSKRIRLSDYAPIGVPFYRGSEISTGGIVTAHELFITEEKYNEIKEKFGVPLEGDLLITAVGTLGNIWKVDDRKFYYKDGNLIQLSNLSIESDYLIRYFKSSTGKRRLLGSAAGSNQKALTMVKMKDLIIDLPNKDEQQKIGTFFKQLDDNIALHQRQLEVLKNMKTSFLQKMYI